MKKLIFAFVSLILGTATAAADELAVPNPILTPGAIDPAASVGIVCNRSTKERRSVTASMKAAVLAAYNVPEAESSHYEIDHLIPLAIGGSNALANLWPQPWVEADEKDVLEVELQREVCHGLVSQAEAQHDIADDWASAYRRRVGGRLEAADEAPAAQPPSLSQRLRHALRNRLGAWIHGVGL